MNIKAIGIWFMSLFLGTSICVGGYWLGVSYHKLRVNLQTQRQLQMQIKRLHHQIDKLEVQKKKLSQVVLLLEQVQKKLNPKNWNSYALNEEAKISPEELRILLETVSKGRPYNSNFWFMPQEFAFLVQLPNPDLKQKPEDQSENKDITYRFKLTGKFLLPQQGF